MTTEQIQLRKQEIIREFKEKVQTPVSQKEISEIKDNLAEKYKISFSTIKKYLQGIEHDAICDYKNCSVTFLYNGKQKYCSRHSNKEKIKKPRNDNYKHSQANCSSMIMAYLSRW
jgi:hemerythrin